MLVIPILIAVSVLFLFNTTPRRRFLNKNCISKVFLGLQFLPNNDFYSFVKTAVSDDSLIEILSFIWKNFFLESWCIKIISFVGACDGNINCRIKDCVVIAIMQISVNGSLK